MITACHRSQFIPWANINIELNSYLYSRTLAEDKIL